MNNKRERAHNEFHDLESFQALPEHVQRDWLMYYNTLDREYGDEVIKVWWWVKRVCGVLIGATVLMMALIPPYSVWQQGMSGKAQLRKAEQNRQIAVNEALAKKESAKYEALAEIERAKGIEKANKIIAESLGGPEGYLRYRYIDALQSTNCSTIYVPTEANIPILEAGKARDW